MSVPARPCHVRRFSCAELRCTPSRWEGERSVAPREEGMPSLTQRESLPAVSMAARPASRRATGIRKGEQET
ncbi:hypothetical protein GCM10018790_39880 [Kitasatospora xanthocidica]|nr:hypothetical protein GCM10018790_39880 [Kitasatospora xanthocidica]